MASPSPDSPRPSSPPARPHERRWQRIPPQWQLAVVAGVVLCSPSLALGVIVALNGPSTTTIAVWTPGAGPDAGDSAWRDGLVGDVRAADGSGLDPADNLAVLPADGDLGRLVAVAPSPGAADPDGAPVALASALSPQDRSQVLALTRSGIPLRALQAYVAAQELMKRRDPGCGITWSLIAGIGRVESNHGRHGGASYGATGRVSPPIIGPRLDGSKKGWATIHDSDDGRYDGDRAYDRAVGPMQFLPGTWRISGADADGDGVDDPQDLDDAALGAARYLCSGGADLTTEAGRRRAVFRYNRSTSYGTLVLRLADSYARGQSATPSFLTPTSPGTVPPTSPAPAVTLPSPTSAAGAGRTPSPSPAASRPATSRPTTSPPGTSPPGTSRPGTSRPSTPQPGTPQPTTPRPTTPRPPTSGPPTSSPPTSSPPTSGPPTSDPSTSDPAPTRTGSPSPPDPTASATGIPTAPASPDPSPAEPPLPR